MKMKLAGRKHSIRTKQWENVHEFVVPEGFHWSVCIIWVSPALSLEGRESKKIPLKNITTAKKNPKQNSEIQRFS